MADGVITLEFDVPISQLVSDSKKIDKILDALGKNAGAQMDSSFKDNSEKVKKTASETKSDVDKKLGKFKPKIDADNEEAKRKAEETRKEMEKIPKTRRSHLGADNSEANRKADETKKKIFGIPERHTTTISVTDHLSSILDRIKGKSREAEEPVSHLGEIIKGTFIGSLASNAVSSAWGHLTGWIGKAIDMGKDYALEQQTMLASWTTLTGSAKEGQAMVDMTNQMAIAANNSTKMVDQLNQKLYAVTNSASKTGELTKSILTLQDAFGVDDAAIANFSVQYSQMIGNGKAQAMDMMSIQNVFPKFKGELLDYMRLQTNNHKLTMQQLNDMMSKGKITSGIMNDVLIKMGKQYAGATENFTKTIPGMFRTIESTMPTLLGKLTQPFAKAANPIIGAISNWVTSKPTEKEFEKIGTTTAEGMNKVINAFAGKGSDSKQMVDSLNKALDNLNSWLKRVFDYIADHAKDIKQFASDLWDIAKVLGKQVWDDWVSIISDIADALGLTAKNSDKATTPMGKLADVVHALAQNKTAIKLIADAIVAISAIKTMNKVLSPLEKIANLKVGKGTVLDYLKDGVNGQGFGGALQSVKSAGGWSSLIKSPKKGGMSTLGKVALAGAVVFDGAQIIKNFSDAVNSSDARKKTESIGEIVGGTIGTAIGAWFYGPEGALLGEQIGSNLGGSIADSVKSSLDKINDDVNGDHVNGIWKSDARNPQEKKWHTSHNLYPIGKTTPFSPDFFVAAAVNSWTELTHIGDKDFWARQRGPNSHVARGDEGTWMEGITDNLAAFKKWYDKTSQKTDKWRVQDSVPGVLSNIKKSYDNFSKNNGWSHLGAGALALGNNLLDHIPGGSAIRSGIKLDSLIPKLNDMKFDDSGIKSFNKQLGKNTDEFIKQLPHPDFGAMGKGISDVWKNLTNFNPQVSGKPPKVKDLKQLKSGILPNIDVEKWSKDIVSKLNGIKWPELPKIKMPEFHPIKWVEGKFKGFKWPKLPKFHMPKFNFSDWIKGIQKKLHGFKFKWPKIHMPKFKWPKIRLPKLDVKGWLAKMGAHIHKFKFPKLKAPKWQGWDALKKTVSRTWDKIRTNTSKSAGKLWDDAKKGMKSLKNGISDYLDDIHKAWHSMWNGLAKWFGNIWDDIKKKASGGINGVIDIINGGIGGINGIIHDFGGKSNTIGKISHVKLATGTGAFSGPRRPITQRTLALLNDGHDSPETGNREMVWDKRTGALNLVPGINTLAWLEPGQEVFNASETAELLGASRFAKGTGIGATVGKAFGDIGSWAEGLWNGAVSKTKGLIKWFKEAMNIVSHPVEALNSFFKFDGKGLKGFFTDLGPLAFNVSKKAAQSWWNQLWSMVGGKLNDGGGEANSKLASEMMKLGDGKKYVWGATGPSAYDCSGLVQAAARKLGVDLPRNSSAQYGATSAVSHPEPGDLVFFGNHGASHVGVYLSKDSYYSAQSPSAGIGVGKISAVHEGPVSYRRIKGLSQDVSSKESSKGVSNKAIYNQVGGGFWKFISKLADLFGDHMANPADDGVERWRPAVKRALSMLHLSTSSSMVNRVLRQMSTESSGNPKAMGGTDGLADGHAMGLMQVKPGTFAAYKLRGHNNIWNGFDNLLAGLNYAKHKYGDSLSYLGNGHGYRNGGRVFSHQLAELAEEDPEYVLNPNKDSFDVLLPEAVRERAEKAPDSEAAQWNHIYNFDKLRKSTANGYRYFAMNGDQQADGGTHTLRKVDETRNTTKGDVKINIKLDSSTIARKTYPKSKLMKAREIDIAEMGGAIPVD